MLALSLKNTLKVAVGILLLCATYLMYEYRISSNLSKDVVVYIPPHTRSYEIAKILREAGAIDSPKMFTFMSKLNSFFGNYLKHGQYKINLNSSQSDIIALLASGEVIKYNITIPEGLSKFQILEILNSTYGLTGDVDLNKYKEGWLMPDTYQYTYPTEKTKLLDVMNEKMEKFISSLNFNAGIIKDKEELLTLASIVEEEASLPEERTLIAAVYLNRLKLDMPLQADPTVIYGITNGRYDLGRPLLLSDLPIESEYNTYLNKGLPATPISNPSRASILAALNPANVKYIYFVADGLKGHRFAETYIEHKKNVSEYRELKKNMVIGK